MGEVLLCLWRRRGGLKDGGDGGGSGCVDQQATLKGLFGRMQVLSRRGRRAVEYFGRGGVLAGSGARDLNALIRSQENAAFSEPFSQRRAMTTTSSS